MTTVHQHVLAYDHARDAWCCKDSDCDYYVTEDELGRRFLAGIKELPERPS